MKKVLIIPLLAALICMTSCVKQEKLKIKVQAPEPVPTVSLKPTPKPTVIPTSKPTVLPEKTPEISTLPVSTEAPMPISTAEPIEAENQLSCTLSVSCNVILENIDKLKPQKKEYVPENGVIFSSENICFEDGESVFDLLVRVMRENNIHLEFEKTTAYNSAYIKGINNIYEMDCGDFSGWRYKVNGEFPNCGCSQYILKDNDVVEWVYACGFN